ncbi:MULTISPECIES: e9imm peptide [Streptomyces]|uniref:E9imm peptide n=1 Tax=Streptomyces venezuelae TaxID=54571 RepID=A0A5P2AXK1_STRVZ|nr:e9imm peptide [Streptomyces venezuelae]QES21651.1 e9imm peptide [Streptomyces venezuelae]
MSREEAISLVQRLMAAEETSEAEQDQMLETLERGLVCPHISDYIFWGPAELTAEQVVDKAMAYHSIAL